MSSRERIIIGTRKSRLALAQTQLVADALGSARSDLVVELLPITTQGDIRLDKPLPQIGGKGLFTLELEEALLAGRVDLAVHSAKDLPAEQPAGLDILCVPPRASANDVLLSPQGLTLSQLPPGSRIGTSSLRRQLQLAALRPDLSFADIRGNIDTRIRKMQAGEYDAIVLAEAGLIRAGLRDVAHTSLPIDAVLPAPGQATLAVQGRIDDAWLRLTLEPINDTVAADCLTAERLLVARLGLDCQMPFAALCEKTGESFRLRTWLADAKGKQSLRTDLSAETWQDAVAHTIATLDASGGRRIIDTFSQPD